MDGGLLSLGATSEDWMHFDLVLGLGSNLLPCVPASPDVKTAEGSALVGKIGKIPSMINSRGEAHGLLAWNSREIYPTEVAQWSADRRLNMCVRTGPISGIYAFDIDIEDERSQDVNKLIQAGLPNLPARCRPNSYKRLLMFRMEEPCKKRKIKLDDNPRGPAIELLADGQQFVACGTHSSGVRYHWALELPSTIPTITLAQLDSIWTTLTSKYAKTSSTPAARTAAAATATTENQSEVMTKISDEDWKYLIECLKFLVPHAADEQVWAEIGMGLLSIKDCGKPVKQLWLDFSRKAPNWEEGSAEQWWEAHAS
jgi:hypothetical protein